MGILLGWLCFLCFLGLLTKVLARKWGTERVNVVLMKWHKPLSGGLFLLGIGHLLAVMPVFRTRTGALYLSGMVAFLFAMLLVLLCHIMHKGKKGWLRWHQILSAVMLAGILLHMLLYYMDFGMYLRRIDGIRLSEITISEIADGEYLGEYDAGYIYAKVRVTIENGRIQELTLLEHRNERGQPAAEVLSEITVSQKFPVDAVSGATNSSKVIQKAVENALTGGTGN